MSTINHEEEAGQNSSDVMNTGRDVPLTPGEIMNRDRKQRAEAALRENEMYQEGMLEGMRRFNSTLLPHENNPYKTKENPEE
ncbi:MAG: hypothetical protein ACLQBP_02090 [Methanoregula sp.]|uniref:hypothetical protein n=1 Tax=Methanoregula sp. TaxID=2052170 RepID=UPI003F94F6FF